MDITPKSPGLTLPKVVLNYDSKKTPGDLYQIVLNGLTDLLTAIRTENDKAKLDHIRLTAMTVMAEANHQLYLLSHPEAPRKLIEPAYEPIALTVIESTSTECACYKIQECLECRERYMKQLKEQVNKKDNF